MLAGKRNGNGGFTICTIMQDIANHGPISRARLAKQTGYSKQTISEVVGKLQLQGWVEQTGQVRGHVGRTAITYDVVRDAAFCYSIDLGPTHVHVALADLSCSIVGEISEDTAPEGGVAVVEQIARLAQQLSRKLGIDGKRILHAVVGVPGVPDAETGKVNLAPNIPGLHDFDFAGETRRQLGIDVTIENDINLAVLGEQWAGQVDIDDMVLVCIGTGIGAGIIVNGKILRGARLCAGELGHLPFGADPFDKVSLRNGALERKVGALGISKRYATLARKHADVPEIFTRAARGERAASTVLDEISKLLAMLVQSLCAMVDPALVIFSGSIGQREELVGRVRDKVTQCLWHPVRIEESKLGTRSIILGGMHVGMTRLHQTLFANGFAGAEISLPQPQLRVA